MHAIDCTKIVSVAQIAWLLALVEKNVGDSVPPSANIAVYQNVPTHCVECF